MPDINPTQSALSVFQEIVSIVANAVRSSINFPIETSNTIDRAKELIGWSNIAPIAPLESIFDAVKLDNKESSRKLHYVPLGAIADTDPLIPYPVTTEPPTAEYFAEIRGALESISSDNWQNPNFLSLFLEKYGSCLSFGEANVALNDFARATAAVAAAVAQNAAQENTGNLRLIAGDLSGIQSFIYNISSDGALKSLRARSFFLELLTEEIVHQLLDRLQLPRSNVIYAGGGNIYILAADTKITEDAILYIRKLINDWFVRKYHGNLFLALDSIAFPEAEIRNAKFAKHWTTLTQGLAKIKGRKFDQFEQLKYLLDPKTSHESCKVCNRDDITDLQPLNYQEPTSVAACKICRMMFELGTDLFKSKIIVRSHTKPPDEHPFEKDRSQIHYVEFDFCDSQSIYYKVLGRGGKEEVMDENNKKVLIRREATVPEAIDIAVQELHAETILLINNWKLDYYKNSLIQPILLGNYYQTTYKNPEGQIVSPDAFIRAEELVEKAAGIDRVGYLRMDVDKLGQIFAKGLGKQHNLPRLAGLSRQMSYFFKVYLNSLASDRQTNLNPVANITKLTNHERKDLLFIYAGGDDLFISGAWNQTAEFACDVYQSFRAYTGGNPDITISGGISIDTSKHPLYRSAANAGIAEGKAKDNDRDSLTIFDETFKWSNWLGDSASHQDSEYLKGELPIDTNIIEMVARLHNPNEIGYSRTFIRNLLALADIRDQKIEELKKELESKSEPISELQQQAHTKTKNDLIYYLHLPKLAYALSRLPASVRENPQFAPVRRALLNPRNSPYFRVIATWVELLNRKNL